MTAIRDDFLDTARMAVEMLRDPAVAARWEEPSALPEFSVRGLAGHLAYQVLAVRQALETPVTADQPRVTVLEHYARAQWIGEPVESEFNTAIRTGGEKLAGDGPTELAEQVERAVAELDLDAVGDRPVRMALWGPWSMSLDDLLLTRLMELAVHADDLAVSVGVPTPAVPERAMAAVLDLLSRLAVRRHGPTAVLRALSRAERAPATIAGI